MTEVTELARVTDNSQDMPTLLEGFRLLIKDRKKADFESWLLHDMFYIRL